MSVSINDVARLANVSITTVSRVVNRSDLVSAKTRTRVESAIRELGYQPNQFARGLMLRKSEIVGLFLPDLHGEFYSEVIRGANDEAHRRGYSLVISSANDGDDQHWPIDVMRRRSLFDGMAVMVSEVTDRVEGYLHELRTPFVMLDGDLSHTPHDSVTIDQRHGALAMVRHLVEDRGARRMIFVGGLETNIDTQARLTGCREVLERNGLHLADEDVYHLDYEFETAYALGRARVTDWAGPGACVFAANDEMAAGIVTAAQARDVAVPQDLAIVGFDDTRIARMTRPPLTTVRVPMATMGARAIELLCTRIDDPTQEPRCIKLEPELVVRESCGTRPANTRTVI